MSAEVGGATAEDDSGNGGLATDARFIFTSIDAVKKLEAACFAIGIDIVAQGAAAMVDGAAEDQFDGAIEAEDLLASQPIGGDGGMNPSVKERLVGVNVADAGDQTLIEQGGFDGAAGFGEASN